MSVEEAKSTLSSYRNSYSAASQNVVSLQNTLAQQTATLKSLIAANASQSDVQAQSAAVTSTTASLAAANASLKALAASRQSSLGVLVAATTGSTGSTGSTNPFVGTTGPTGAAGPTGPSVRVVMDTSPIAGSLNPVTSSGAYNAIQSLVSSSGSGSGGGGVTVGTSSSSTDVIICHFEGANGSTTFTDSSSTGTTLTNSGTAALTTSRSKFGSSCLNLTNGSFLSMPLTLGTSACTIECWVYLSTLSTSNTIFSHGSMAGYIAVTQSGSTSGLFANFFGANRTSSCSVTTGVWHHVAMSRDSSTNRYYFWDGTLVMTATGTPTNLSTTLYIGKGDGTRPNLNGYIDDLRITGRCLYTSDFIPPNLPHPDKIPSFPASNNSAGQVWTDGTSLYICTVGGNPGTWKRTGNGAGVTSVPSTYTPSSFSAFSILNSNTSIQPSRWQLVANDQRLVMNYDGVALYLSTSPFTSTPTMISGSPDGMLCLLPDGSRGVVAQPGGSIYTFTWTGSTYGNFTVVSTSLYSSVANKNWAGASMTSDGSRVVIIGGTGVYWLGGWNGSTYTTWTKTLDASADLTTGTNWGVGVSPDGSKIAYSTGSTSRYIRYALWNGSNYDSGARFTNTSTSVNGFGPVFHPSGTMVYLPYGGANVLYMYSVFDSGSNTFGAAVAIANTSIQVGYSGFGFAISSNGSFVLAGAYQRRIIRTNVTYMTS